MTKSWMSRIWIPISRVVEARNAAVSWPSFATSSGATWIGPGVAPSGAFRFTSALKASSAQVLIFGPLNAVVRAETVAAGRYSTAEVTCGAGPRA
jgi:hypothetical protein